VAAGWGRRITTRRFFSPTRKDAGARRTFVRVPAYYLVGALAAARDVAPPSEHQNGRGPAFGSFCKGLRVLGVTDSTERRPLPALGAPRLPSAHQGSTSFVRYRLVSTGFVTGIQGVTGSGRVNRPQFRSVCQRFASPTVTFITEPICQRRAPPAGEINSWASRPAAPAFRQAGLHTQQYPIGMQDRLVE